MKKTHHFLALFLVLILYFSGCRWNPWRNPDYEPAASSQPVQHRPYGDFVWEVQGGQSRVYLMGTMHATMPEYALTPQVAQLLAGCDALAVESDFTSQAVIDTVGAMGAYADGSEIYDHLSARGIAHFEWLCKQYNVQPQRLASYTPITVSSFFTMLPALELGFVSGGADALLLEQARAAGQSILEMEDGVLVMERFLSLPDDTLERVYLLPIQGREKAEADVKAQYERFLSGDVERYAGYEDVLAGLGGGDGAPIAFEEKDELYEQYVLTDRNRDMASSIIVYLETPGRDVFAAAGVAHFVGSGSIIELLETEGYAVRRLDIERGVPQQPELESEAA